MIRFVTLPYYYIIARTLSSLFNPFRTENVHVYSYSVRCHVRETQQARRARADGFFRRKPHLLIKLRVIAHA